MSKADHDANGLFDLERRNVLRAAIGGVAASGITMNAPALAQNATPSAGATFGNRNNAALGARLQGVQHFGLTVQNMDRAFEFYTGARRQ